MLTNVASENSPISSSAEHEPSRPTFHYEQTAFQEEVDEALLEAAAKRAERLGCSLHEVLRAHGILSSDRIIEILAHELGLELDPLDDDLPALSSSLIKVAQTGVLLRRLSDGQNIATIAPRGVGIHRLAETIKKQPELVKHLRITSPERFDAYLRRCGATELAHEAALGLFQSRPDLSAASRGRYNLRNFALLTALFALAAGYFFPHETLYASEVFLGAAFLAWVGLRLCAFRMRAQPPLKLDLPERALPYYTIVVPLFREGRIVERLADALGLLNYPIEKLDIKFVCESDDTETLDAIKALRLDPYFELIVAPQSGPRTKPKALAAALPFARGSFLVVYDAEDEPEPDQLRWAVAKYHQGPPELACVQAKLSVDNVRDNWLTRHFAAEYAGLFDVFLPVLADLRLPLPLGGTSNHFRTDVLRAVGGWDPFNVTEDADLGMRLARFGYISDVIDSTTYEEAPAFLGAWLRQRTRWCKGWLQTWLVHMRSPLTLLRELGFGGFCAFQLLVGGTVFAALVHPFFLAIVLSDAALLFEPTDNLAEALRRGLAFTTLASGYLCSAALGFVGLSRRKLLSNSWVLVTIPIYWILLSVAAWRAAFQLVTKPHLWEKTEHGLAKTSRYGRGPAAGKIPPAAQKVKAAAVNRPRPRPHYASD